uniref:Uncharacterized protein n=1 Tax=Arundo donax TaxID=35708 RepID=A0A0A8YXS4_ARUDO
MTLLNRMNKGEFAMSALLKLLQVWNFK